MRAAGWVGLYLLLVVAPFAALLPGELPPSNGFWFDLSVALGFAGMAMMGVQFLLTSRFRRLSAPFGIDVIYLLHRYLAWIALTLVAVHFAILWLWHTEALGPTIDPREAPWELTAGRAALLLFALAVVTSQWRKQLRLEYGMWRYSHVALATLGFAAAVAHIVGIGNFTAAPGKRILWLSVTLAWVLQAVRVRVVRPWPQRSRPWRVVAVRPERNDTVTLALEPEGHDGLRRFLPGQFAWITLRASPFGLREHPYTIVSAPEQLPRVEFGIKALGNFSAEVSNIHPGERAWLDAPYGVFSIDRHRNAPGLVGIVGGIGITPMLSMLRSLGARRDGRPVWLFYGNKSWDETAYREELETLRTQLDLKLVHVLEDPPPDWEGERGFITRELLERHLPEGLRGQLHYFLCGPPPLTAGADAALRDLGVPDRQVHTELFELA
ncbi:MAG: ferric reductase-like transmembrane domain-containing protein [Acetobacteraceae bacterium]